MTGSIPFRWEGDSFVPMPGFARRCDAEFVVGQVYRLEVVEERSAASHAHYFACINEAWQSLPETLAHQFPTAEHLRKYALIKAGYADRREIVVSSKAEARRVAVFIGDLPEAEFAIVVPSDAVVTVWTARSQSVKAMGKKDFQDSKTKVLDVIAAMIGVTPGALSKHVKAA